MKKILFLVVALLCVAGSQVVAQDSLGTTRLWRSYTENFDNAIFSHDGRFLFAGGRSKSPIIKYNALTGEILDTLNSGFSSEPFHMNMLPGDSILTFIMEMELPAPIKLNWVPVAYNIKNDTFRALDTNFLVQDGVRHDFLYNKDYTKYLIRSSYPDHSISIYDANTNQELKRVADVKGCYKVYGWTSDSTILCKMSFLNVKDDYHIFLYLYNINTGKVQAYRNLSELGKYEGANASITSDGKQILFSDDLLTGDSLKLIKNISQIKEESLLDKSGRYIFYRDRSKQAKIYDLETSQVLCTWEGSMSQECFINDSNDLIFDFCQVNRINWDFITDVPEESFSKPSKIFPNPASTYLCIESDSEIKNVELYDILGIRQKIVINNNTIILIDNMPKGIYFVKYDTNGKTYFDKVIIE